MQFDYLEEKQLKIVYYFRKILKRFRQKSNDEDRKNFNTGWIKKRFSI